MISHTVLHQFQMPLEEEVSNFSIFWSTLIAKNIKKYKPVLQEAYEIDITQCEVDL